MIHINKKYLPAPRFSLAISGGVDSLACFHLLSQLGYNFTCVHYNHNQREQNDRMEEACRRLCKDFQIKIIVGKCDIKANNNVEDILRKERHKFFAEVGGAIVAAHHLNDCVENYISNALKGCPENKPIPEFTDFGNFQVYRPFLRNPKKNLENWIDKKQLHAYIERDESNNDNKYRRNWLRNVIIPAIEERSKLEKVVLKKFYL